MGTRGRGRPRQPYPLWARRAGSAGISAATEDDRLTDLSGRNDPPGGRPVPALLAGYRQEGVVPVDQQVTGIFRNRRKGASPVMFDDDEFGRLIRRGIATQAPPEEYWPAYETRLRARLQA